MDKTLLYLFNNLGLPFVLRHYKQKNKLATVLCLHRISDQESAAWPPMKINDFKKLLEYIRIHYSPTTIEGLSTFSNKKPAIVLSFDDGFKDFLDNGLPLLKQYNIPCNLNVVTRCLDNNFSIWTQRLNDIFDDIWKKNKPVKVSIQGFKIQVDSFEKKNIVSCTLRVFHQLFDKPEDYVTAFLDELESSFSSISTPAPMMNWKDLNDALHLNEIELGSHSCSHYTLTNIEDEQKLKDEIVNSKLYIEEKTGRKVNIFAAPNGKYNEKILSICKEAGYKHFLTVDEKLITTEKYSAFAIPRILIAYANHNENMLKVENFQNHIKQLLKRK